MGDLSPIDPTKADYMWRQVYDAVVQDIRAGRLKRGAMLSGERAMARELGVAVGTVRRALVELREKGFVVTLPAKGTFVMKPPSGTDVSR